MGAHESSVNYQNLIRDLAEMYPFDVAEVVVVELIANSLDAKATRICIDFDPQANVLVIGDNGAGMDRSQFEQYHDFAVGLKTRGQGIGFAGVGAKISFNVAVRVVTETRSKDFAGGSNWHLESERRLVWEDIPVRRLKGLGTRVEVYFAKDFMPPWSSRDDLVRLIHRHYLPLLDTTFRRLYKRMQFYGDLRFVVNGEEVPLIEAAKFYKIESGTLHRFRVKGRSGKRVGLAVFGLSESEYPVAPDVCGVLLCTMGKVIKADLFNQFPGSVGPRIFGLVEVPSFVEFLTTSKTDFMRGRAYRKFAALYNPIGQQFKTWLSEVGVQGVEVSGTNETRELERELQRLLEALPELAAFSGTWARGRVLVSDKDGDVSGVEVEGVDYTIPVGEGSRGQGAGPAGPGDQPGISVVPSDGETSTRAKPISRTRRRGPQISFAEEPGRTEVAWVAGDTIMVNTGHPCYGKVRESAKLRKVYSLFAIAIAIQRFLHGDCQVGDLTFIDRMMAAWAGK